MSCPWEAWPSNRRRLPPEERRDAGEQGHRPVSATVVCPSLTWADVYATAAFVRGENAASWIATLPHHAAVLVHTDGRVRTISPAA
jgi:thiamine biosynthesis lipoprotein ApbE